MSATATFSKIFVEPDAPNILVYKIAATMERYQYVLIRVGKSHRIVKNRRGSQTLLLCLDDRQEGCKRRAIFSNLPFLKKENARDQIQKYWVRFGIKILETL